MKKLRYLECLFFIAVGILLVHLALLRIDFFRVGRTPVEIAALAVGLLLILWQFIRFNRAIRRDATNFIVLKSETGSVRVHASAVEEALRHTATTLPGVHDVSVKLVIDKQTRIPSAGEVDARISDITNIISVHDALSRVLSERYEQIIPGAPPIEFHLTIKHHFKPPTKRKKRDKGIPPEEDETKAIRAPQYPVPD